MNNYPVRTPSELAEIRARFDNTLKSFTEKLIPDPNVMAILIAGSASYDTVWEKSDMDITVLVRDQKLTTYSYAIDEDGIVMNVDIKKIFDYKRMLERNKTGDFLSSYYCGARIVYSADESLEEILENNRTLGESDRVLTSFKQACWLIGDIEKIEKWLTVRNNPLYAQHWVLKAVDLYASMLLLLDGKIPNREAVVKAYERFPDKLHPVYVTPMSKQMTHEEIAEVIDLLKGFLEENLSLFEEPVKEYMGDGEVRTVTNLVGHFGVDSHSVSHIFDFLAEQGVVVKVSELVKITPKSRKSVEEIAYMYINEKVLKGN